MNQINSLDALLNLRLPGLEAQLKMAPIPIGKPFKIPEIPDNARQNGVLILIHLTPKTVSVLITLRSSHLPTHKGQLSFPGGRLNPGETVVDAALRETREEVGCIISADQIIGKLSPVYTPNSVNVIHPIVAVCKNRPSIIQNPDEVDEAFWLDLKLLQNHVSEIWELRGMEFQVPFWPIHRVPLWGATAMILSELLEILSSDAP